MLIHVAADVAQRRRERGLRLNHPESVAILTAFVLEGARDGRSVAELMDTGRRVLTRIVAGLRGAVAGPLDGDMGGSERQRAGGWGDT